MLTAGTRRTRRAAFFSAAVLAAAAACASTPTHTTVSHSSPSPKAAASAGDGMGDMAGMPMGDGMSEALSVYKPRGMTAYGWRKQREMAKPEACRVPPDA
jgi:hypothetical protein